MQYESRYICGNTLSEWIYGHEFGLKPDSRNLNQLSQRTAVHGPRNRHGASRAEENQANKPRKPRRAKYTTVNRVPKFYRTKAP